MRRIVAGTALGLAAALGLSGCGQPKQIYLSDGYVRLGAIKGNPAAAYFTVHGGATDATLIDVTSSVAIKSEMHESMAGANAMMKPVQQIAIPAKSKVRFEPGGRHVMLFNVNPGIVPGHAVPLLFTFGDGSRIEYDPPAIAATAPAPKE